MKLFDKMKKFFNSTTEKAKTISLEAINEFFASLGNDGYVDDLSEMTYFVCIKTLSESMGKLTCYLLDEDKRRIKDHETVKILQYSTNEIQTPSQFFTLAEYNRNHRGNSYSFINRNSKGGLISLIPLDPRYVQIWINNTQKFTELKYYYFYADPRTGKSYWLHPEDVLHFRSWICEDNGIVGRSVREILARGLAGAKASSKFLDDLYRRGMLANLVIHHVGDLNRDMQNKLLERIEKQARTKDRRMITLPADFKAQPLDLKLTDSQFLEIRQYTALQISSAFAVKPTFLNDYEKASYANSTAQNLSFYVDSLLPIITYYEQEMNRKLLSQAELMAGLHFKFNVGVLLRNNPTEQAEIIQKLVQSGIYSPNDARKWLDMPPIPGDSGNKYLVNGSMTPLEDAGAAYRKNLSNGDENVETK